MQFDIIDFHTHPFTCHKNNLCSYSEHCNMTVDTTIDLMNVHNVSKFCGSVICMQNSFNLENAWQAVKLSNDTALELAEIYNGRYIPGFHIHPHYITESCEEIERMNKAGVKLIGELVPYIHHWSSEDYTIKELYDFA